MAKKGFTLIELLVVIAIIGIISAFSLTLLKAVGPSAGLSAAARDLASDLRYAQQLAVSDQNLYNITFAPSSNSYEIRRAGTNALIKKQVISGQLKLASIAGLPANTTAFTATGAATYTGTITLSAKNGRTIIIEIKPSGYVKIIN